MLYESVHELGSPLRKKCSYSEFFWSVFSHIRTEYRDLRNKSLHSVREKTDQKNSEYRHFVRSALQWEVRALPILCRINKFSKPLSKIDKLTFTKIYWQVLQATTKSKQPSTLSCSLSVIYCSHVTYLTYQDTAYQSSQFVCDYLSLSPLLYQLSIFQLFSQKAPLSWPQNLLTCLLPGNH